MRKVLVVLATLGVALSALVAAGASGAAAQSSSTCTGSFDNTTWTTVVVPANTHCSITDSTIKGSVSVGQGASLETCADSITGSITASHAYLTIDPGTVVGGSINVDTPTLIPITTSAACWAYSTVPVVPSGFSSVICPNTVGGSIVEQNFPRSGVEVLLGGCTVLDYPVRMSVGGSVLMANNRSYAVLYDTDVRGNVTCANDNPHSQVDSVTALRVVGCDDET